MKLLIITQKVDKNDPILGFFHAWLNEFAKNLESIIVICLYKGEVNLPNNVKVLPLGKENGVSRIKYIFNFYKYIWNERKNYDKVFVHMNPIYVILGGFAWSFLGKRIALWYTHKNVDLKLKLAEKICHVIFTASKESFRLKTTKLKIMGHGIDTDVFHQKDISNKDQYSIVSVGRISQAKNQDLMIEALGHLKENNIQLILVGDAITKEDFIYKDDLKKRIEKLGLINRVSWIGSVNNRDVIRYYQNANLFINLSNTGSLDKAILEAMSCGLQVLTSNEAFKNILDQVSVVDNNVRNIAEKIVFFSKKPISRNYRDYIIEKHQLKNLIMNIVKVLE